MNQEEEEKTEIDLWELAKTMESGGHESLNVEKTIIIIGEQKSGKSSFINILKGIGGEEKVKATSAIDYQYLSKTNINHKELLNIYELGEGRNLQNMIQVPITIQNYQNFAYILVVDLSQPETLIDTLQFWLGVVRKQTEIQIQKLLDGDQQAYNQYLFQFIQKFQNHDDRTRIEPLPAQIIVIGQKYDKYEKLEGEHRKWISRTLRFFCHQQGASLFYSTSMNHQIYGQVKSMVNNMLFENTPQQYLVSDHMKPMNISAGMDQMASMGLPASGTKNNIEAFQRILKEQQSTENNQQSVKTTNILDHMSKYQESKIDSIRAEKDAAMEHLTENFIQKSDQPIQKKKKVNKQNLNDNDLFRTDENDQGVVENDYKVGGYSKKQPVIIGGSRPNKISSGNNYGLPKVN